MNLRETIAIEIHAEGWNGGEEWADVHPVKQDNYRQQADAAITAFTEALLSDEAVAAAARPIADMCRPAHYWKPGGHGPSSWLPGDDTPIIEGNKRARGIARQQITAALAAMGAVTEEEKGDE